MNLAKKTTPWHVGKQENNSIKQIETCVCSLVFTTSKGVVKRAAVDPAKPPQISCEGTSII